MKTRNYLLVIVIGILLIFGTGGAAFAQPPAFPVLNEYFVNVQGQVVGPYAYGMDSSGGLRNLYRLW